MADKIDQVNGYDIDLPPDATPSLASLTATGLITSSNGNLPKAGGASLRNMIDSSTSIYEGRLEVSKGASNITNAQSTYYQVDKIIRKTNASTTFTLNLPSLSNGASQTLATETYVTSRGYVTQNDIDSYIDATFIIDALGYTPQSQLATQTAYTNKGGATKVPRITTNTLGQVTGITEVDITNDKVYKHEVVITDSSTSTPRKICFALFTINSAALDVQSAINLLYNGLTLWNKSTIPVVIVTEEWTSGVFLPRHTLGAITKSGVSLTKFTIQPMEGGITYNQVRGLLSISSSSYAFTVSNLSISDNVLLMNGLII